MKKMKRIAISFGEFVVVLIILNICSANCSALLKSPFSTLSTTTLKASASSSDLSEVSDSAVVSDDVTAPHSDSVASPSIESHRGATPYRSFSNSSVNKKRNNEYFSQHDLCEYEIIKAEKKYGIPRKLLMAIGTVESGRVTGNATRKRPYPWTICANGKSYFLSTKNAAIATVKRLMARGIRNIDVGCMQVNLMHHSRAFKTLEEAFTPQCNVKYASQFFMQLKNLYGSWTNAVGYYHSKASKYYKPYCSLVFNAWRKLANIPDSMTNSSLKVQRASSKVKSDISFLPSYYSLIDKKISEKLHRLGRMSISKTTPKFFTKEKK